MSENSNTDAAETLIDPASRIVTMNIPIDLANEMLAQCGVPMPNAADLDEIRITVDHSPLFNGDS